MKWILVALGLVVLLQSATALRCWSCASNSKAMCGDPMNTTEHQASLHAQYCKESVYDTARPICRKIIKKVNGERIVIRQCSSPNVDEMDILDGPCSPAGQSSYESCHICSTDLCNSAATASTMYLLYAATFLVAGLRFLQTNSFV